MRSSITQRLGMENAGTIMSDRNVDGMVDMMIDATSNCFKPLTKESAGGRSTNYGWKKSITFQGIMDNNVPSF